MWPKIGQIFCEMVTICHYSVAKSLGIGFAIYQVNEGSEKSRSSTIENVKLKNRRL